MKKALSYFTAFEKGLWCTSIVAIFLSFLIGDSFHLLSIIASFVGVTALLFLAKGHMLGQILTIVFSLLYGAISFEFSYYGEMITYLGMTAPMAALALWAWIKNPFTGNKSEVSISHMTARKWAMLALCTICVTLLFHWILAYFHTAQLLLSTLSIATSFVAAFLTYLRSDLYALAYACNDLVLIALWCFAAQENTAYYTMVFCFAMFLLNDLYGYYNWRIMKKKQHSYHKKQSD